MTVVVEWMDGEVRRYSEVNKPMVGSDRVLRLYGYEIGGRTNVIAELPIDHIREWKYEGRR